MAETSASDSKPEDGPAPKKMRKVPTVAENRAQLAKMTLEYLGEDRIDEYVHVIVKGCNGGIDSDGDPWEGDPDYVRLSPQKLAMNYDLKAALGTLVHKIQTDPPEKVVEQLRKLKHLVGGLECGIDKDWAIYVYLHDDEAKWPTQIEQLVDLYRSVLELYPFAYEVKVLSGDDDEEEPSESGAVPNTIEWDAREYANKPDDAMEYITDQMGESLEEFITKHKDRVCQWGGKCKLSEIVQQRVQRIAKLQDRVDDHLLPPPSAPLLRIYVQ